MEQLTPDGLAGVAVVRVAPSDRAAVMAMLNSPNGSIRTVRAGVPLRATLRCEGRDLDDVLVVDRGSGGLELHLHGSSAVLAVLADRLGTRTPRPVGAAAALLQRAVGDAQLDLALEQMAFDFDREVAQLQALPAAARATARAQALARSRLAMAQTAAPRVVLFGQQNAGKSSLFNRLLCRERALTGPVPGLTRDPVAEVTVLAGYPYELVDTAGEGHLAAAIDAAAVGLGRNLRDGAIRILVIDGSRAPDAAALALVGDAEMVVASKSDLPAACWPDDLPRHLEVSVVAGDLADLRHRFGELLRVHRGLPPAGPVGGFAAIDHEQLAQLLAVPA